MCRITKKEGKNHKTAGREKNVLELPLKTDFTGKVVVVTGAGGVLCGDMARAFAQAGAKVAALDLNEDKVKKLAEELKNEGFVCEGYGKCVGSRAGKSSTCPHFRGFGKM